MPIIFPPSFGALGGGGGATLSIANASYDGVFFDVSNEETIPESLFFRDDGSRLYVIGAADSVFQYDLSPSWDITSASLNGSFSTATQEGFATAIVLRPDGTQMFICGITSDSAHSYNLSTPWDVTTATFNSSFDLSNEGTSPRELRFKSDGTRMFFIDADAPDVIFQYDLSGAWDITTAVLNNSFSVDSTLTAGGTGTGLDFDSTGLRMFVVENGTSSDKVYQFTLSTPWDVTTASFDSVTADVATEETAPTGVFFKPDETKMFIIGNTAASVFQYSL